MIQTKRLSRKENDFRRAAINELQSRHTHFWKYDDEDKRLHKFIADAVRKNGRIVGIPMVEGILSDYEKLRKENKV